jgi:hypothetical protein
MVTKQSLSFEVRGKTKWFFRYARNGDPNGYDAPYWPAYGLSEEKHLTLG